MADSASIATWLRWSWMLLVHCLLLLPAVLLERNPGYAFS
jgi:hypothetical protein